MTIYVVVREISAKLCGYSIIMGAWDDQRAALKFVNEQDSRPKLREAARVLEADIHHRIIPLEIRK